MFTFPIWSLSRIRRENTRKAQSHPSRVVNISTFNQNNEPGSRQQPVTITPVKNLQTMMYNGRVMERQEGGQSKRAQKETKLYRVTSGEVRSHQQSALGDPEKI